MKEGALLEEPLIRQRRGRGFSFLFAHSRERLRDTSVRHWIKSLAIPPAWQDVHVYADPKAKIYAWGRDEKSRKQYIYNPKWRARREKRKFDRIVSFAERLTHMRRVTGQHLNGRRASRNRVLACMVRLIDNAYFRPGSKHYTEENQSFGLTTLRSKHVEIHGSTLEFNYQGKSGQIQHRVVEDSDLAKVVKEIDELPGYEIFKYLDESGHRVFVTSDILNDYIREVMDGPYTAKDFRTWAGTYLAAMALAELGCDQDSKKNEKNLIAAIDQVAAQLGNTRAVARANYIDPRILGHYSKGRTISEFVKEVLAEIDREELTSPEEQAVLKLLRTKL